MSRNGTLGQLRPDRETRWVRIIFGTVAIFFLLFGLYVGAGGGQ